MHPGGLGQAQARYELRDVDLDERRRPRARWAAWTGSCGRTLDYVSDDGGLLNGQTGFYTVSGLRYFVYHIRLRFVGSVDEAPTCHPNMNDYVFWATASMKLFDLSDNTNFN
jgi:hypothetical protein